MTFTLLSYRYWITKSFYWICNVHHQKIYIRLVQESRVEGHMFISSCKNTKIATGCWTTIKRRTLEPTKKRYPRPKTKKLQGDGRRGASTIKSNPIFTRWVTHNLEDNNTKEVLPLLWKFWVPCQASQPGDLVKGLGIPRNSDFEGQQDLIIGLPQDWG